MVRSNACAQTCSGALWPQIPTLFQEICRYVRCDSILSHRLRPLMAAICLGAASRFRAGVLGAGPGARPGRHRRRRRKGDRRGRQHLDVADRRGQGRICRRRPGRDAATAAGLAVRGILRRILQEPPRRSGRRSKGGEARRARSIRSAPASSSTPPASPSPTTTSSPMPTRSTSSSTTAPRSRPSWSAATRRPIWRC